MKQYGVDGTDFLPVILIETTNYAAGSFSDKDIHDDRSRGVFDAADDVFSTAESVSDQPVSGKAATDSMAMNRKTQVAPSQNESSWRYAVHIKAPPATVIQSEVYGYIHTLFVCNEDEDDPVLTVYHPVSKEGEKNVIGVNAKELFLSSHCKHNAFFFQRHFDVCVADLQTMQEFLYTNSPISLPRTPNVSQNVRLIPKPCNRKSTQRFVIKHMSTAFANVVLKHIQKRYNNFSLTLGQPIELFSGCFIHVVDVPLLSSN
jgi:hypothetical protein